jgi:processive 1,2-diacylglycerol beta-glucosyltransferase
MSAAAAGPPAGPGGAGRPARVLVLTASVGEGHDLPARVLAADLRARGAEVDVADGLVAMGRTMRAAGEGGMRATFGLDRLHWVFDLQYLLFARLAPTRALGQWLMYRVSGGRLARFVAGRAPDAVVSTHPAITEALGQLRRRGRLGVSAIAAVTDLASLRYWASRGIDVHLLTHPESQAEVRAIAGPDTRIVAVHGLTDPAFLDPPSREEARRALGLPEAGPDHDLPGAARPEAGRDHDLPGAAPPEAGGERASERGGVVAVSGGGWGVGDLAGAARVALRVEGVEAVLCLCGRNARLRARLEEAFAGEPRVRVLGFVDRMVDVMAAADVLVHSTAGLTVLEAWMLGCRPISYGWGIGHIRLNNRAFRRFGIADVVDGEAELGLAIARALAAPRTTHVAEIARLPAAAEVVLEVAGG